MRDGVPQRAGHVGERGHLGRSSTGTAMFATAASAGMVFVDMVAVSCVKEPPFPSWLLSLSGRGSGQSGSSPALTCCFVVGLAGFEPTTS